MRIRPRDILGLIGLSLVGVLVFFAVAIFMALNPRGTPYVAVGSAAIVGDQVQLNIVSAVHEESFCCSGLNRDFRQIVLQFPITNSESLDAPTLAEQIDTGNDRITGPISTGFGRSRILSLNLHRDGSSVTRTASLYGIPQPGSPWGLIQTLPTIKCASQSGRFVILNDGSLLDCVTMKSQNDPQIEQMLQTLSSNPVDPMLDWQLSEDLKFLIAQPQPLESEKIQKIRVIDVVHGYREFNTEIDRSKYESLEEAGVTRGELRLLCSDSNQIRILDDKGATLHTIPRSALTGKFWDAGNHRILFWDSIHPLGPPSDVRLILLDYETGKQQGFNVNLADLFTTSDGQYVLKTPVP